MYEDHSIIKDTNNFSTVSLVSPWWLLINSLSKIVLFITSKSQITMASPLEIVN